MDCSRVQLRRCAADGQAEAESTRAVGAAKAEAYEAGVRSMEPDAYTAVQLAGILGSHGVKLVPDVSVSGAEGGGSHGALAGALMGRMVGSLTVTPVPSAVKNGHQ